MSVRPKTSRTSITGADWLSWPGTVRIFDALAAGGHKVRAVGGAVRDTLLGRPVQDIDFATDASPETVMELVSAAGLKAIPTGLKHGTVTVVADQRGYEVTTLRQDIETFGRHATVEFTDDWGADASRRDFSINALYVDADGAVFDPLDAIADIEERRVRFIGDARARVEEDYLRILRFFRFNAELETSAFDEDGLAACVRERHGLHGLSGERVAGELIRLLRADGAIPALRKMYDHGLLVDILRGVPNIALVERLVEIETTLGSDADAVLRLAALGVFVREDAERLAASLRLSNAERDRLAMFSVLPNVPVDANEAELSRVLFRFRKAGGRDAALKSWAASGKVPHDKVWQDLLARLDSLPVPEFPVKGADLVGLGATEGPALGQVLNRLEARWLEGGCADTKTNLLAKAGKLLAEGAQGSPKG